MVRVEIPQRPPGSRDSCQLSTPMGRTLSFLSGDGHELYAASNDRGYTWSNNLNGRELGRGASRRRKPREGFPNWVRFDDGTTGNGELDDLADRGVFKIWADRRVFESVRISDAGAIERPGAIDLCADALYLRLTGK